MNSSIKHTIYSFGLLLALIPPAKADTGVLVPNGKQAPDPSVLSLTEMQVDIRIDNGDARVWIRQIFLNHTASLQEGNYLFALPSGTQVSDFAVWDGPVRIPAVILERKRAEALYQELKSQAIDPGLLEQGERTEDDSRRNTIFSAHIVPIPALGTKRLEIEYHQHIAVDARKSYFLLPLKPDAEANQKVARLSIRFELHSAARIKDFADPGKLLPFKLSRQDEHTVVGTVEASNIDFGEDFAVTWGSNEPANAVQVIAYRSPNPASTPASLDLAANPNDAQIKTPKSEPEPGFFEVTSQLSAQQPPKSTQQSQITFIVLMDTSLSMQWEKLERSYAAAAKLLESLQPIDRFNLLLFNTRVDSFRPTPVAADQATVKAAIDWLRSSHLRGGTDLQKALEAGLSQSNAPGSALVLLTDGGVDRGLIQTGKLAAWYTSKWNQIPAPQRPKTDVFAVGDDANLPLLRLLARNDGAMEQVLSTEPVDFKLASFLSKTGQSPIGNLRLSVSPQAAVEKVYALEDAVFDGGEARWVGQYEKPVKNAAFRVEGQFAGQFGSQPLKAETRSDLPAQALEHDQLPRLWAGARVQALLEQIERDGETEAAIQEIIRLARKYKFVTPYTSFLAAPRALLRPRVIRPGDPILRVHTDPAIVSVIALFPFDLESGPAKPLRYLAGEDVWQTRFLAPTDLKDGSYTVRLVLRDKNDQVYRENKSFVIASKPPTVRVHLDKTSYRPGDLIPLTVNASETTRTLTARVEGLAPVTLRWNHDAQASTGRVWLPPGLPAGQYTLNVTAEDMAHNLGNAEVRIEVLP
jgi:Ca-activated chloride channel family protein